MATFFDKFPLIRYSVDKKLLNEYDTVTNILFRINIIKDVMEKNINAYYYYIINDADRPEILAEKIYGNPESYWILLYANNIYDPYYDWPMDNRTFDKYIIDKYGSTEWAKTNIHHYEKVITRENPMAQVTSTTKFEVNENILTNGVLNMAGIGPSYQVGELAYVGANVASNTFSGEVIAWTRSNGRIVLANTTGSVVPLHTLNGNTSHANCNIYSIVSPGVPIDVYTTIVDTTDYSTHVVDGKTVFETISRNEVSYYDYEQQLNEDKRMVKIIHPQYYNQIISEFDQATNTQVFYRRP